MTADEQGFRIGVQLVLGYMLQRQVGGSTLNPEMVPYFDKVRDEIIAQFMGGAYGMTLESGVDVEQVRQAAAQAVTNIFDYGNPAYRADRVREEPK